MGPSQITNLKETHQPQFLLLEVVFENHHQSLNIRKNIYSGDFSLFFLSVFFVSWSQTRLTAAMEYYEQLKDSCLSTGSTAQERAARRAEEIQSLKEAMDLLETGTQ